MTHNPAEALREAIIEECANAVAALMDEHRHSREWNDTINCAVVTVRELAALSPAPAGGEAIQSRADIRKAAEDEIARIRTTARPVTPPPSPDVAGVVDLGIEMLKSMLAQIASLSAEDWTKRRPLIEDQLRLQLSSLEIVASEFKATATLLTTLSAERERLVEALTPFAKVADAIKDEAPDNIAFGMVFGGSTVCFGPESVTIGDFRRARTALTPKDKS